MKKKRKILRKIVLTTLILSLSIIVAFSLFIYAKLDKNVDITLLQPRDTTITRIFYYDFTDRKNRIGNAVELEDEAIFLNRSEWKSIYDIPSHLKNAFVAIEDKRFYEHKGVDWLRTAKATMNYLFRFDNSGYGGSTITQQLIKNVTGDNETTPKRKLEEIFRAKNIEKKLSKNEILESYLNVVYMSEGCYGVGAAAKLYFNKEVGELTLAECATLAAIVQNPTKYDPFNNPENNKSRRNVVLKEMHLQGKINDDEYRRASKEEIVLSDKIEENKSAGVYSWYTEALLSDVCKDFASQYNVKPEVARNLILKGGFNIYSLIDPKLQKEAEKVYLHYQAYIQNQNGTYPQSSCVILDPETSDILALVGGVGEKKGNLIFNRATSAKRPPGSVIKPLSVYSVGLEEGMFNYSTVFDDTPLEMKDGTLWPKNSPDRYRGLVPLCYALEHSINTVAVKALKSIGYNSSFDYLLRYGINLDEKDRCDSSLALGQLTYGESLLNITNAYCTFANGGSLSKPKTYLYLTDSSGQILIEKKDEEKRILSRENAYIMTMMLKGVVDNGTAAFIDLKNSIDTAGKTGTSSNNEDKWFIGYTPYYVCGVWTGYDTPSPMYYTKNPSCVLFDKIMEKAHLNLNLNKEFSEPFGVTTREFCFDSGKLYKNECSEDLRGNRSVTGYFTYDNMPTESCDRHKTVFIDAYDGMILENPLLFWRRRRVSLIDYARQAQENLKIEDSEYLIESRKRN